MYRFGSHVSCAGGLLQAVERARELGCQCLQIFVSTPRAWPVAEKLIPLAKATGRKRSGKSEPMGDSTPTDQDPRRFQQAVAEAGLEAPIAHACYLINLASPDPKLWNQSTEALWVEWKRAEELQLSGIVLHPGAHTTASVDQGLENVIRGIRAVESQLRPQHCPLLLENTAGQGTCLGWKIEQLGYLLKQLSSPMVQICWDTCHALAAGYDFRTPNGLREMVAELQRCKVLEAIRAVHVNDSMKDCGSRVDRHEHIGLGYIGDRGWKLFLESTEFRDLPMYLETEKGVDENGEDWDLRNLRTLRSYISRPKSKKIESLS